MIVWLGPELVARLSRLDSAASPAVAGDLNTDLAAAVRRTALMRRLFYAAVLAVALDEVARRLREGADYDGLTAQLGSQLTAERVLHGREDDAAVAARAWLAEHRDGDPASLPGPQPDDGAPRDLGTWPSRGLPSAPPWPDADDTADLGTQAAIGVRRADRPVGHVNGRAPRARDSGSAVSVPALRLGPHNAVTVSLDDATAVADHVRSVDGPDGHTHAIELSRAEPDSDGVDPATVDVRVLGTPALLDARGSPVRGLRTKSMELLVYQAVHRDGAPQADIVTAIWPDVPPERAAQRLFTCLANLRSIIRQVRETADADGGNADTRVDPVIFSAGTYRLDPALVTVDWWQTVDRYTHAADTGTDSATLADWRYTIDEALDSLAEDSSYPWLDADRQRARHDLVQPPPAPASRPAPAAQRPDREGI